VVSAGVDQTIKLWDAASARQLTTLRGHGDAIRTCTFSPDGRRVLSASEYGRTTLTLWDAASGRELTTLAGHIHVLSCAFSPDGSRVLSASADGTLKIWDAASGRDLFTLTGHTNKVLACAFSPDGTGVVSAGFDQTIKLWDAASGRHLLTLAGHTGVVRACAFSPDGNRVLSASEDGRLKLWDAASGRELASLEPLYPVNCLAVHPSRLVVACGGLAGFFCVAEIAGATCGPPIVTAADLGRWPVVRCPVCLASYPLQEHWLGREIACPVANCDGRLQVNHFVVGRMVPRQKFRRDVLRRLFRLSR
jgi:WD40 repeat protein